MSEIPEIITTIIIFAFWLTLYFLPSILAHQKPFAKQLFLLNLFAGWTIIGWIASLIWAVKSEQKNQTIIINHNPNSDSSINNIAQLEKLSQLYQQDIVTYTEFMQQKNKLLGKQIITPIEPKPKKKYNKQINIAIIATLVLGLALIVYGVFDPFSNPENTVKDFLDKVERNDKFSFNETINEAVPGYFDAIHKPNALPQVIGYNIISSTSIDSLPHYYFIFVNVVEKDEPHSVTFLVTKQDSRYRIIDSYDFLTTNTNQIVFPANMGDSKRIQVAKQSVNVEILLSSYKMVNNRAAGSIQVKNNFTLPIKNLKLQVQYLNKQQQEVKAEIVNAFTDDDEIQPQEDRIISWVTDDCKNCQTANVIILNNKN